MSEKLKSVIDNSEATGWERLKENDNNEFNQVMEEMIKEDGESYFNSLVNCGGFALEIFACVFSASDNIDEAVENIIKTFPFVRLKGETELASDEYEVAYRHADGGYGHHFVKMVNGEAWEKNEAKPIQKFEGWGRLEDAPEVVFAVKKEHEVRPRDDDGDFIFSFLI